MRTKHAVTLAVGFAASVVFAYWHHVRAPNPPVQTTSHNEALEKSFYDFVESHRTALTESVSAVGYTLDDVQVDTVPPQPRAPLDAWVSRQTPDEARHGIVDSSFTFNAHRTSEPDVPWLELDWYPLFFLNAGNWYLLTNDGYVEGAVTLDPDHPHTMPRELHEAIKRAFPAHMTVEVWAEIRSSCSKSFHTSR
jgi:hypothetical protein